VVHAQLDPRLPSQGPEEVRQQYCAYLAKGLVLLAEDANGEAFGVLAARIVERPPVLHLCDAFVARSKRRRGVLRAMVTEAVRWGQVEGATGAKVEWAAENSSSSRAWAELGFAPLMVSARADLGTLAVRLSEPR
jgi:GNAT superfamily N-acetyltransferase